MFVNLFIQSKNLRSIKKLLKFLNISCKSLGLIVFQNSFNKPIHRKVVTVLKSPHVNKAAQEHFGFCTYRYQINFFSYKYFLLLMFLKYLKSSVLFSDVHFKVKVVINHSRFKGAMVDLLNPNNFCLMDYSSLFVGESKNFINKNISYYLMLFDLFGELSIKKGFQNDIK